MLKLPSVLYMPAWVLQGDLPTAAVRRMIGPDRLLGVSVKTVEQVGVGVGGCWCVWAGVPAGGVAWWCGWCG